MAIVHQWFPTAEAAVELELGAFGRKKLSLNGTPVGATWTERTTSLQLPDNRVAKIVITPTFGSAPRVELRVDGHLVMRGAREASCPACHARAQPADARCGACGAAIPDASQEVAVQEAQGGATTIFVLAGLFALGGIAFFFIGREQAVDALANLSTLEDDHELDLGADGGVVTVAALRAQVEWEMYSPLVINGTLCVLMIGLGFWARRAPLPALLTAAAVYASVVVLSAIADPTTIAQGIIVKILIVAALARAIQAAFKSRAARA